jgi:hypothetical protein
MTDRPDWDQWILQKNAESKVEELKKSESIMLNKSGGYTATLHEDQGHNSEDEPAHVWAIHHNGKPIGHASTSSFTLDGEILPKGHNHPAAHEHIQNAIHVASAGHRN